jgi:hypothetical protein
MSMIGRAERAPRALAPRAVRMRNACVRHAAARLGIAVPGDRELSALPDDTSLRCSRVVAGAGRRRGCGGGATAAELGIDEGGGRDRRDAAGAGVLVPAGAVAQRR